MVNQGHCLAGRVECGEAGENGKARKKSSMEVFLRVFLFFGFFGENSRAEPFGESCEEAACHEINISPAVNLLDLALLC